MNNQFIDLRKHPRVFFSMEEHIEGKVAMVEASDPLFSITFLSLSEGGISFLCDRGQARQIGQNQIVAIRTSGAGLLAFLNDAVCEVRYVLTSDEIPLATIGCQFKKLPNHALDEIRRIVKTRLRGSDDSHRKGIMD